jgi:hypothetical protein
MPRSVNLAAILLFMYGSSLFAVDNRMAGTWKLNSEHVLDGDAPSLSKGAVMRVQLNTSGKPLSMTLEKGILVVNRVGVSYYGLTVSPDGRTLTETKSGVDAKSGKYYRSVLVWEKQ